MQKLTPCLWFDTEGEDAAKLYTSIFPNSSVGKVTRYGPDMPPPMKEGDVLTVSFTLDGQEYLGLNGGPQFSFSEAISFQIMCQDQEEATTTGTDSPRVARRASAAGSRTSSASPGR